MKLKDKQNYPFNNRHLPATKPYLSNKFQPNASATIFIFICHPNIQNQPFAAPAPGN